MNILSTWNCKLGMYNYQKTCVMFAGQQQGKTDSLRIFV